MPLAMCRSVELSNVVIMASPRRLISVVIRGTMGVTGVVGVPVLNVIRGVSCIGYPYYSGIVGIFNRDRVRRITTGLSVPILTGLPFSDRLTSLMSGNYVRLCRDRCLGRTTSGVLNRWGGGPVPRLG